MVRDSVQNQSSKKAPSRGKRREKSGKTQSDPHRVVPHSLSTQKSSRSLKRDAYQEAPTAQNKKNDVSERSRSEVDKVEDLHPLLLNLLEAFLKDHGFKDTGRRFSKECQAKGKPIRSGSDFNSKGLKEVPKLEQIFHSWHQNWFLEQTPKAAANPESSEEISSSEEDDSDSSGGSALEEGILTGPGAASTTGTKKRAFNVQPTIQIRKARSEALSTSSSSSISSGSNSSEDDDVSTGLGETPLDRTKRATLAASRAKGAYERKRKAESSSSETTSDEEDKRPPAKMLKAVSGANSSIRPSQKATQTVNGDKGASISKVIAVHEKIKRPAEEQSTSSSFEDSSDITSDSSDFTSESESEKLESGKTMRNANARTAVNAADAVHGPSDSGMSSGLGANLLNGTKSVRKSSNTIAQPQSADSFDSSATVSRDGNAVVNTRQSITKRSSGVPIASEKVSLEMAQENESTSRPAKSKSKIMSVKMSAEEKPSSTKELHPNSSSHPSNQYQSYSYADRAYHDLSVTRGKGFTKEKNKKKRGSYRGGAIDTSGGKAFKFED